MKTTLYELIRANTGLQYIDASTGKAFTVADFHESIAIPQGKGLAFLYLDNSIASIETLLNFLRSDWAICLLSPKLEQAYKSKLEQAYLPGYIYDPGRGVMGKQSVEIIYTIDPAIKLLLSTSGSTGSPKMVKLSEENLVQNALSILDYLPVQRDDTAPLNLPLFYSYGFSVFSTNSIAGGNILCTNRDMIQKEFWEDWKRYGCCSLAGVPYVYEMIHRFGLMPKTQPTLRYMTQAGGKMSIRLLEQFATYSADYGFPFYTMYGQTEATARMSWLDPAQLPQKAGSIGKPVSNGSFHVDAASSELLYSGPNVFGGYAEHYKDLAYYEQPAVLATGDIAEQDDDGFYYIKGRIKRFVKLFGNRINLDEAEQLLLQEFPGANWLCLGSNDQFLQVMYEGIQVPEAEVRLWLSTKLSVHPNAIKITRLDTIPLTGNGKPDYAQMGQLLGC